MSSSTPPRFFEHEFTKAARSTAEGGECVRLARKDGFVAVYSDRPGCGWGSPVATFTEQEFAVFAEALANGEFGDFPVSG
jgi:hypothetical protein